MKQPTLWEYFIIGLLIGNAFLVSFIVRETRTEGGQCIQEPLVYGYNKLQEVNKDKLSCSCELLSTLSSPKMVFDSEGVRISQIKGNFSSVTFESVNYSELFTVRPKM
jgi:hypothetical protein